MTKLTKSVSKFMPKLFYEIDPWLNNDFKIIVRSIILSPSFRPVWVFRPVCLSLFWQGISNQIVPLIPWNNGQVISISILFSQILI